MTKQVAKGKQTQYQDTILSTDHTIQYHDFETSYFYKRYTIVSIFVVLYHRYAKKFVLNIMVPYYLPPLTFLYKESPQLTPNTKHSPSAQKT